MKSSETQKHTPGPWRTGGLSGGAVFSGEKMVAAVYGDDRECNVDKRMQANARLIAAAPELLEALRDLDECYCEAGQELSREDRHRHRMTLIKARAAISRATGTES